MPIQTRKNQPHCSVNFRVGGIAQYSGALTLQLKILHTPKRVVAVLHVLHMLN